MVGLPCVWGSSRQITEIWEWVCPVRDSSRPHVWFVVWGYAWLFILGSATGHDMHSIYVGLPRVQLFEFHEPLLHPRPPKQVLALCVVTVGILVLEWDILMQEPAMITHRFGFQQTHIDWNCRLDPKNPELLAQPTRIWTPMAYLQ